MNQFLDPEHWQSQGDLSPLGMRLAAACELSAAVYSPLGQFCKRALGHGWWAEFTEETETETAFLMSSMSGGTMVVILRGTEFSGKSGRPSVTDLHSDFDHVWRRQPDWAPKGIRFALGSLRYVDRIWDPLMSLIRRWDPSRIFVLGHSLGGSGAHTLGCRLVADRKPVTAVYGIEPPRVASAKSAKWADEMFTKAAADCYRVVSVLGGHRDWVPRMPPKWFGARHLGKRIVVRRLPGAPLTWDVLRSRDPTVTTILRGEEARVAWEGHKERNPPGWWRLAPHVWQVTKETAAHSSRGLADDVAGIWA